MSLKKKGHSENHKHSWSYKDSDISSEHCECGLVKISQNEYDRRVKEWSDYFDKVRDSDSYGDYQLMKQAFNQMNKPLIKEIMARIKERTHKEINEYGEEVIVLNNPIPRPKFPDPTTWNKYIIS